MLYYADGHLVIRDMTDRDALAIVEGERAQGWVNASPEKYYAHMRDRQAGRCACLVAVLGGAPVGYIQIYWNPENGPFANQNIPELVDFGVLGKVRRQGIGTKLMDAAEQFVAHRSDRIAIGVGMHSGYGAAQRMYVLRGYVPDGTGVWYRDRVCPEYADCCNDDDLVLYLSKSLKQSL